MVTAILTTFGAWDLIPTPGLRLAGLCVSVSPRHPRKGRWSQVLRLRHLLLPRECLHSSFRILNWFSKLETQVLRCSVLFEFYFLSWHAVQEWETYFYDNHGGMGENYQMQGFLLETFWYFAIVNIMHVIRNWGNYRKLELVWFSLRYYFGVLCWRLVSVLLRQIGIISLN